jgi:hypothetical protein
MTRRAVATLAYIVVFGTLPAVGGCTGEIGANGTRNGTDGPGAGGASPSEPSGNGAEGPGPVGSGPIDENQCRLPSRRLVKLTPTQYDATVRPHFSWVWGGKPSTAWSSTVGSYAGRFSNDADRLDMSQLHVARVFEGSRNIAKKQTEDLTLYAYGDLYYKDPARFRCADEVPTAACVRTFLADWMPRIFRRPLWPDELDRYVAFYEREAATFGSVIGFQQVTQAVFMSPHALYRTEIGDPAATADVVEMTAHEKAQAISFLVTDRPPDPELELAAASGTLDTADGVRAHTERLLMQQPEYKDSETTGAGGVSRFWGEYLNFDAVRSRSKAWRYPEWGQLQTPAARETRLFVDHWFWRDNAAVKTLLSADYSFVNASLAANYGIEGPASDDEYVQVTLPPERRGLLTQTSFLGGHGKEWSPDIVHRGLYIQRTLLCGKIPQPPADVPSAGALPEDPNATHSEIVATHSELPSCWGCHKKMDPLGRPFQAYDTIGRHRTVDTDESIRHDDPSKARPLGDVSGGIVETVESDVEVANSAELIQALADSRDVARCVAVNVFRYAHARFETASDACVLKDHYDDFLQSGGDVRSLLLRLTSSDDFFLRTRE